MFFKQLEGGYDYNFSYVIADEETKDALIVDPFSDEILSIINKEKFKLQFLLNTHSHFDHMQGNKIILEKTKTKLIIPKDKQIIKLGKLKMQALFTPGHAPDHFCFLIENKLITGDLLFVGAIGGTGNFFKGSDEKEEFRSLAKILKLPDNTEIWPGHNYGSKKSSTIGHEKKTNPYLNTD